MNSQANTALILSVNWVITSCTRYLMTFYLQILVVVDAKPKDQKLPTDAYYAMEEVHDVRYKRSITLTFTQTGSPLLSVIATYSYFYFFFQDGTLADKTFEHVGSEIGAEEAEEVGVEHLLR